MIKKYLIIILKFLFSGAIVYWLIQSGKLDFSLITKFADSPVRLTIAFIAEIFIFMVMTFRYLLIIRMRSDQLGYAPLFKYNWIAQFFNAVLPGSVTGDLIKVFYLNKEDPKLSKPFLFGSIVIDRFTGLFGLIISLGFFSLINYSKLSGLSKDVETILNINLVLIALVICGLIFLFKFESAPLKLFYKLKKRGILFSIVDKLESLWSTLASFKKHFFSLLLLSVIVQALAVILFWFIAEPYAQGELTLSIAFSLVPIGFIALALPVAPSGMGVGHAVFHSLFLLIGISNGASLFNLYFIILMLTNLTGIIPYLLLKRSN